VFGVTQHTALAGDRFGLEQWIAAVESMRRAVQRRKVVVECKRTDVVGIRNAGCACVTGTEIAIGLPTTLNGRDRRLLVALPGTTSSTGRNDHPVAGEWIVSTLSH